MFSGSQGHIPHNSEKFNPLTRQDAFFENIQKDFQSQESAGKTMRKFLNTENILNGFTRFLTRDCNFGQGVSTYFRKTPYHFKNNEIMI